MNKINVGIDIAKNEHYASFINSSGEVLIKPFKFTNDPAGFKILEDKLNLYSKDDIIIGFESTAQYANSLMIYFFNKGYGMTMINPLKTHALRNINIRGSKTDRIDATLIATFLRSNEYKLITQKFIDLIQLKTLVRNRQDIVTSCSKAKIQLLSALDQVFPEYANFFKASVHGGASYALLKEYQSPKAIAAIHLTKLTNLLLDNSHKRFGKHKATALKELAQSSIGLNNKALELTIKHCIEQIEMFSNQKTELEKQISILLDNLECKLTKIKGIGKVTAAIIIAEIGDINRFKNSSKLLAFAGLDPKVKQSGNFNASSVRMSKRGSRLLRYSLIFASENLVRNTTTFADYYIKKRDEGKSHYQALGHCAGKFIRILFRMLKDNTEFNLI
jgi:transposase